MKKARVFFVAAAMLLVTAGVFAGKAKFATASNIYYLSGITSGTYELLTTVSTSDFQTTGTNQAQLVASDAAQNTYPLYTLSSGSYVPVYTTF